ncbi:uncharacterized protein JN550_008251 [Neoarthrinium moseri]|uniref:uncharacterized protein n=1 Tax=Neoarthrinium moseri TaxID=1658444 RepID=UPI001FDD0F69|nr:uncharacterized protein JN550_008251 [Neoarthrinium moseri]KAI1865494.1 hypothetical protein JN550_008251 [Neoarthrinium moseri]
MFTLGLAPLIAHILSGAPQPSYLTNSRPKWHDVLCHYNPASILWRYAAIADRRIRSPTWNSADMAVANAIFWTQNGWDGQESMLGRALPHASRLPDQPTVKLLSLEMLKTIIVFLQGVQAITSILGNFTSFGDYTTMDTVSGLFIPLGASGLARLWAAQWLTDDFAFIASDDVAMRPGPYSEKGYDLRVSVDSLVYDPDSMCLTPKATYRIWRSRIFRALYMVPVLSCFALDILFLSPWIGTFGRKGVFTVSSWLMGFYYMTILAPTTLILGIYFTRGPLRTTIIPCMSTVWYKAYCLFLTFFTVVLIAVAAIETRKTFCGKYTTLPPEFDHPCAIGQQRIIILDSTTNGPFGFAQGLEAGGLFEVANFTGTCLGIPDPASLWRNATIAS